MCQRPYWLLLVVTLLGCGQPSERLAFSGQVSSHGQPLTGTLTFKPQAKGPVAIAPVQQGRYRFTSSNGPLPGSYQVTFEEAATVGKGSAANSVTPRVWTTLRTLVRGQSPETRFEFANPTPSIP